MKANLLFLVALALCLGCAFAQDELCPTYTLKSGDGLFQIVEAGKAKGLSFDQAELVATLEEFTGYTDGQTLLQAGQVIPLPGYKKGCKFVITTDPIYCLAYQVQPNDTAVSIADSLGYLPVDIQAINGDRISAAGIPEQGVYLRLPGWDAKCKAPEDTVQACQVYTTKQGDTISSLTKLYKLDPTEFLKLNSLTEKSTLTLNQQLRFPPWPAKCDIPSNQKPARLPGDTATTCRVVQLQTGQGLYDLALTYGKTLNDIYAANPGTNNNTILKLGSIINIDDICDCNATVLVGNGTLPTGYVLDKSNCKAGASGAPTIAPAPAPAPRKALAPAPAPAVPAPAPAIAAAVQAPAEAVTVTTVSGAAGISPQLTLLAALVAAVVALF